MDITDEALARIERETREQDEREPRVKRASYVPQSKCLILDMVNGAVLMVPAQLLKGFEKAKPQQIEALRVVSNGTAIHWDELDVQMTTLAIIQRVLGVKTVAEHLRRAGSVKSEAKSNAARLNGAKGGRPRKMPVAA
jgi:hypothetical protein